MHCERFRQRWLAMTGLLLGTVLLSGCSGMNQVVDRIEFTRMSLDDGALESAGIGFLTPAAATGREADKQALAMLFSGELQELRPDVRVVALPAILSAVNAAQLDQEYKQMYRDYLETGILDGELLRRVGTIGDVRYLAQLNLASFEQQTRGRFGVLGLRLMDTKQANMRVFIQIWDSQTGAIAWEGGGEVNYAYDTTAERPITFHDVAEQAARRIFADLPSAAGAGNTGVARAGD